MQIIKETSGDRKLPRQTFLGKTLSFGFLDTYEFHRTQAVKLRPMIGYCINNKSRSENDKLARKNKEFLTSSRANQIRKTIILLVKHNGKQSK